MKSLVPHIIIGALVAGIAGAGLGYMGVIKRHNAVVTHMESARQLRSNSPQEALDKLLKVEGWANTFPDIATDFSGELVRGYTSVGNVTKAKALAAWLHKNSAVRDGGIPCPSDFPLSGFTHDLPTKIYNTFNKPKTASAFRGYEVLTQQLFKDKDHDNLRELQPAIRAIDPNHQLLDQISTFLSRSDGKSPELPSSRPASSYANEQPPAVQPENMDTATAGKYWGIVRKKQSPAWDTTGRLMRKLDPGVLVDISSVRRQKKKADLALCNVSWKGKVIKDVYITLDHLEIREGTLATAPSEEKRLRQRNAELQIALADYEQELKNKPADVPSAANIEGPEDYKRAKAALDGFYVRASKLQKEFDGSTGGRRGEIMNQLRMMKHEEAKLKAEFNKTKEGYKRWQAQNGGGSSTPAQQEKDDKLVKLQKELSKVLKDLKQY